MNTKNTSYQLISLFISTLAVLDCFASSQDCISAIHVCTNYYLQNHASVGYGSSQEILPASTCLQTGETNSTWYAFKIKTGGSLLLQINPLVASDDYDFIIYKSTGDCADIISGINQPVICNYSSTPGTTGLSYSATSTTSNSSGSNQSQALQVSVDETYYLMVNNYTSSNSGYELTFSGTAVIYDTEAPLFTSVDASPCSPVTIALNFSEGVKCSTIDPDGSDFKVTGPSSVFVIAAWGTSCNTADETNEIKISFSSPVMVAGTYKVIIHSGNDGNTLTDFCGNAINSGTHLTFNVDFVAPTAIVSSTNAQCNNNNGTASIVASGGLPPYSYSWNSIPVQTSATAINLGPGSYTCATWDGHGCVTYSTVFVSSVGMPQVNAIVLPETCDSLNNGSITLNVTGGTPPYSYQWTGYPGNTSNQLTDLAAGVYHVIITTQTGCIDTLTINVNLAKLPVVNINYVNAACNNETLGSAASVVTGNAPFIYLWSTGATTSSIQNLPSGSYQLTVYDSLGCMTQSSVVITNGNLQLQTSHTDSHCGNNPDGTATVISLQVNTGLLYLWETQPVQTTQTANHLGRGTYTVIVTDSNSCSDSAQVTIDGPFPITAYITIHETACSTNNGSAALGISGGVPPYSILWNSIPAQYTAMASNLAAGSYIATVTDAVSCATQFTVNIGNFDGPVAFIGNVKHATCNLNNGEAGVVNITGNDPFTFSWNSIPQQHTQIATSLAQGNYTVGIADSNGCLTFLNVKIDAIPSVEANLVSVTNASCGHEDGSITVAAVSGTLPYSVQWSGFPSQHSFTATLLAAGNYMAVVTDSFGCKDTVMATVGSKKAHSDFTYTMACLNTPANFNAISDYPGTILWQWYFNDPQSDLNNTATGENPVHTFTSQGEYIVELISQGGCASDTIFKTVQGGIKPEADFKLNRDKLFATSPVKYIYTGTVVTEYNWDFGDGSRSDEVSPFHSYKAAGSYDISLIVNDQYGCADTAVKNVEVDLPPTIFIPDAFTPNGDGINDFLKISANGLSKVSINIYDRWGNDIYSMDNLSVLTNEGWDGSFKGKIAAAGSYTYILKAKMENDRIVVQQGSLNILR